MTINLAEITFVVLAALSCGLIFEFLKQPAALGYILAGIVLNLLLQVDNKQTSEITENPHTNEQKIQNINKKHNDSVKNTVNTNNQGDHRNNKNDHTNNQSDHNNNNNIQKNTANKFQNIHDVVMGLAHLGVILLLFLVGMELSLKSFGRVWKIAVSITIANIALCVLVVFLVSKIAPSDLSTHIIAVLSCSISLSSTAVAVKMLERIGELRTEAGKLSIGILIAQDLAIGPMLLLINAFKGGDFDLINIAFKMLIAIAILLGVVLFLSKKDKFKLWFAHLYSGHEDLQPLVSILFCFGMASLLESLELSSAYGAFIGGLIIGNSSERQSMLHTTKPIQSLFMMVFFFSVGLLFDYKFIYSNLGLILGLLGFITAGKVFFNVGLMRIFRIPWKDAVLSGLVLSQIGEFAFVLSESIIGDAIMYRDLIVSLAVLSLALSPFCLILARRIHGSEIAMQNIENVFVRVYDVMSVKNIFSILQKAIKELFNIIVIISQYFINYFRKTKK